MLIGKERESAPFAMIVDERKPGAVEFYNGLYQEVSLSHQNGINELENIPEGRLK